MDNAIVIIHPSEIIRRGLASLFDNQANILLISEPDASQVKTGNLKRVQQLILMLPSDCEQTKLILELRTLCTRHLLIGIEDNNSDSRNNNIFDHSISLDTPLDDLHGLMENFFTTNKSLDNDDLSKREKEVLRLIAMGKTNKGIAEILFISTHTVISHRKNITDKLGIKSIPGLTVYAIIKKIIDPSEISSEQLS